MNAKIMINREVSDLLTHQNTVINNDLSKFAKQYYGSSFTIRQEQEICSLPIEDKIWLLDQYKEEITTPVVTPELNHLY
jgi:hypothetical protein